MKKFSSYLLIVFIVVRVVSAPTIPTDFDICKENNGNIQIKEVFRWKNNLLFFGENDINFKISNFSWNWQKQELKYGAIEQLNRQDWTQDLRLITSINYPVLGLRALEMDIGEV